MWDHGYLGLSIDTYRNDYCIVAEDEITIQMRRDKLALAGELRSPDGFIRTLRAQAASTDYQHQEIEGDGAVTMPGPEQTRGKSQPPPSLPLPEGGA